MYFMCTTMYFNILRLSYICDNICYLKSPFSGLLGHFSMFTLQLQYVEVHKHELDKQTVTNVLISLKNM